MATTSLPPLISSDGHLEVLPERWSVRMPVRYRDKAPRTIKLIGGPLVLTDKATTTIIGPGSRLLTFQGDGESRVFDIRGGSAAISTSELRA